MIKTPNANRLHIAIFGKRNAGKSSLINAITNQETALVSQFAGTTTDPVYKPMELLPIGPVVLIDTAGIDDQGDLGELRVKKTREVMAKTDLALLVIDPLDSDLQQIDEWYRELHSRDIPIIGVINRIDEKKLSEQELAEYTERYQLPFVPVSAKTLENIDRLKLELQKTTIKGEERGSLLGDIIKPRDVVLLVMPQDIQAPKGRLILPQAQVIRDILDHHALAIAVTDNEMESALDSLRKKPDLVITDSQVFAKVNEILPEDVPLTSFSIIMARDKGDLAAFVEGAKALDTLKTGDKVLIAEACTHHALKGDIGRQKIPAWLKQQVGGELDITINTGTDFSEDLSQYHLIIHCGACMFNRKQVLSRIEKAKQSGVPITNYGICIAHLNGMLNRVIKVF